MNKLATFMTISLLSITLAGCGSKGASQNGSSSDKTSSSKKTSASALNYQNFQSVKVGSFVDGSGSTTAYVRKALGKPTSTTTTKVSGKESKTYVWSNLNSSFKAKDVTISFENGRAIAKGYANADINHLKALNHQKVNSIKIGDSYNSVIQKLGQPSSESESGSGNISIRSVVYLTGKNGESTSFVFNGDKVNQITKSELK
ncbi:DUF3862 domain-containing protein [Lactobacillus sp. Sy-1]|uniref:DUF3862 domain-containing protein n=1 Tax=Lactobacillus sp. Sy-1 TaxID=2109645 RepID=UPI001C5A6039|nr:DUF3862 domain-containing protein [Lactobacillus sp. Sy-1]MBW1606359.1 DUF3862 domain-containing protein [Lactobacillus sp. Sy-1]